MGAEFVPLYLIPEEQPGHAVSLEEGVETSLVGLVTPCYCVQVSCTADVRYDRTCVSSSMDRRL